MRTKKKVSKVARKPKVDPWRAELARIVRFLNKGSDDSRALWDVLSALRGPDFNENAQIIKRFTTSVIREKVGLEPDMLPAEVRPDSVDGPAVRSEVPYGHFYRHAYDAFHALGLDWPKTN